MNATTIEESKLHTGEMAAYWGHKITKINTKLSKVLVREQPLAAKHKLLAILETALKMTKDIKNSKHVDAQTKVSLVSRVDMICTLLSFIVEEIGDIETAVKEFQEQQAKQQNMTAKVEDLRYFN